MPATGWNERVTVLLAVVFVACGGPPEVAAGQLESCLTRELGAGGWSELPLSETGTVYGVDFGPNSVLVYVEPDASAMAAQIRSIREAEEAVGNTGPDDRVILQERGNILVSWPNEPTPEQSSLVDRCVGSS